MYKEKVLFQINFNRNNVLIKKYLVIISIYILYIYKYSLINNLDTYFWFHYDNHVFKVLLILIEKLILKLFLCYCSLKIIYIVLLYNVRYLTLL